MRIVAKTFQSLQKYPSGYVLVELMVVFTLMALLIGIYTVQYVNPIRRSEVDNDLYKFSRTLQMMAEEAVLQGRRFTMVIDITDGYYTIYEEKDITDYDMYQEPLFERGSLDISYIEQVVFEDGKRLLSGDMELRATPVGWKESVVFDLIDDRMERTNHIRCERGTTRVIVSRQPLDMPEVRKEISL